MAILDVRQAKSATKIFFQEDSYVLVDNSGVDICEGGTEHVFIDWKDVDNLIKALERGKKNMVHLAHAGSILCGVELPTKTTDDYCDYHTDKPYNSILKS